MDDAATLRRIDEAQWLGAFVAESNRIEGMPNVTAAEVRAHQKLLGLKKLSVPALVEFVSIIAPKHVLRISPNLNVRVGNHIAPRGGPEIEASLADLLGEASQGSASGHAIHCRYETLHPFTDGNGRSGRAVWLWMMQRGEDPWAMRRGFLHSFYYQTLAALSERA